MVKKWKHNEETNENNMEKPFVFATKVMGAIQRRILHLSQVAETPDFMERWVNLISAGA